MHCARCPVLSVFSLVEERRTYICPPPLFMEEKRTYICPPFCGRANKEDHCLIFTIQVFFRTYYIHNLETEKSVAMATLSARYC